MLPPTTKCAITSQKAINKEVAKVVMQTTSKLDVVEGMWRTWIGRHEHMCEPYRNNHVR
jgi:hypothetical protein